MEPDRKAALRHPAPPGGQSPNNQIFLKIKSRRRADATTALVLDTGGHIHPAE
jgi:hypothetical protein